MNEYFHTTITQWPGNIPVTDQIHELVYEWQVEFNEWEAERATLSENDGQGSSGTTPDQWADSDAAATELARQAAGILLRIGTRMAPAVVAERCDISIAEARAMSKEVR